MDSETTTPPNPDPLAAMFQNATIDRAEKSARDLFKPAVNNHYNFTREGENTVLESSDVIDFFQNVVQPLLAEVRKNDQIRSTVGDTVTTSADGSDPVSQAVTIAHTMEGDPVNVINLLSSEPSSLPVSGVADRYTRSMLKCLAGYPLYEPQPLSELSTEYLRNGVNIGDVGFVKINGTFDFLFNVCPSNASVNPPKLPEGFSLETSDHSVTSTHLRTKCLFPSPITRTNSGEYICEGSEGAILELPEGAIEDEATNILPFEQLAARHGVQWYEHTIAQGRKISNGSLYLITSVTKCIQWGIAVFDRKCAPGQGFTFDKKRFLQSTSKYHWKGSCAFHTKVSDRNQGDAPNQCVFLRGYKIMIRQDIFDNLCDDQPHASDTAMPSSSTQAGSISLTRQPAALMSGGGSNPMSKTLPGGGLKSDVVLYPNFDSSPVHPSDLINSALLNQNPDAKVALTHDDVWCDVLRDNLPKLNYATLINIAQSYTNTVDEYGCVTLEKISDSNTLLKESYRPLQGTEISALQVPLPTSDDDYAHSPATISLGLPHELVERIFLLLDTESILACRLVNREFNEIIQTSTVLQYFLACKAAGVIDNPQSPLSYAERLEELNKREDAWRKLKPVFKMTISVNNRAASKLCRKTEGVYFLSDDNLIDLNYCHLTSFPEDNPRWIRIPGHGPALNWSGILVSSVAALYEHDLLVNLISSDSIENQADIQQHSLDLVLLKFSTGEYHPLAGRPRIHVQKSPDVEPWVFSRIVGDNLALVIHSPDGSFFDKLFIFDWKTGHKLLEHGAAEDAYFTLDFLSPELLLVPNLILSHFEVWHIPPFHPNAINPVRILSLQIPTVSHEYSLFNFDCCADPNVYLHSMPYLPQRPFSSSPEDSIIVARLRLTPNSPFLSHQPPPYNLIMHRRALLDTIQKWTSPSIPTGLTNEVTVHNIADPADGSLRLDARSKLISTDPRSSPRTRDFPTLVATSTTCPSSDTSTDSGPSSSVSGLSTIPSTTSLQVPWSKWGPPISRWFGVNEAQGRWLGHSYGQRFAFSERNPLDRSKLMISVADFNPHNFRRNAEMMTRLGGEGKDSGSNGNNEEWEGKEEEKEFEILDHKGVFSGEVYMGLKCVVYRAPDEYDSDLVVMDEQRLFGVKLGLDDEEVESIKVLYIG